MNGVSASGPNRPASTKELSAMAEDFQFQPLIPFKYWARSADTLYQEANFAYRDGDYKKAYLMLWRHSTLVLQHLPKHTGAKLSQNKIIAKPLYDRQNKEVFRRLEELKPLIDREYDEWKRMTPASESRADGDYTKRPTSYEGHAERDPTLNRRATILDASDHLELAVDLAQQDYQRRDARRRGTRQAGVTEEEERERRKAGSWENWDRQQGTIGGEDDDFRRQMEATRRRLDRPNEHRSEEDARASSHGPTPQAYHYPSIERSQPVQWNTAPLEPRSATAGTLAPLRPPKDVAVPSLEVEVAAPSRPPKRSEPSNERLQAPETTLAPPARPSKGERHADISKKERVSFRPAAYLENGDPIRPVFVPTGLKEEFLRIASDNTRQGLEMCGMLCGRPVNNALFVSCLLIPEQKCTTDTCETENESGMLDYCINEDLLIIGWIHTHPTQTCFMSSRDLHTQAGYQVMMPESIAIVCAPRHSPSYGIFRLTNPPGLSHILQCTQSATFHMHDIDNIYTRAGHPPGHVYHSDKLDFYVQDLRPGY